MRWRVIESPPIVGNLVQDSPLSRWAFIATLGDLAAGPQTTSGITLVTMEDEHGLINRQVADVQRRVSWKPVVGRRGLVAAS